MYGNITKDEGEIDTPIGRSKKGYKMSAYPNGRARTSVRALRTAVTKFKVIKRFKNHTLLKIQTLTGRTHQIRVHLHSIGHPIVGDPIYKSKKIKPKITIPSLFLHADFLEFHDLNNQPRKFKLDLPDKLKDILNNLDS